MEGSWPLAATARGGSEKVPRCGCDCGGVAVGGLSSLGASLLWRAGGGRVLIKGRDFFPVQNLPSRTQAGHPCGSRGSTGELLVSSEGRLGQVWGRKHVLLTGGPLPGRRAPGWAGLGLAAAPGGGGGWAPRKSGLCWQLWALPLAHAQAPEVQLGLPGRLLQPCVPGNKLTQKDNADSGVQFITPAGPRQSLLLAKDPIQHL